MRHEKMPTSLSEWERVHRHMDVWVGLGIVFEIVIAVLLATYHRWVLVGSLVVTILVMFASYPIRHRAHDQMIANVIDQEIDRALEEGG